MLYRSQAWISTESLENHHIIATPHLCNSPLCTHHNLQTPSLCKIIDLNKILLRLTSKPVLPTHHHQTVLHLQSFSSLHNHNHPWQPVPNSLKPTQPSFNFTNHSRTAIHPDHHHTCKIIITRYPNQSSSQTNHNPYCLRLTQANKHPSSNRFSTTTFNYTEPMAQSSFSDSIWNHNPPPQLNSHHHEVTPHCIGLEFWITSSATKQSQNIRKLRQSDEPGSSRSTNNHHFKTRAKMSLLWAAPHSHNVERRRSRDRSQLPLSPAFSLCHRMNGYVMRL